MPPDDLDAFAEAMAKVAKLTCDERQELGQRGREHVLAEYDYRALAGRLAVVLAEVVDERAEASQPPKVSR